MSSFQPAQTARLVYRHSTLAFIIVAIVSLAGFVFIFRQDSYEVTRYIVLFLLVSTALASRFATWRSFAEVHRDGIRMRLWRVPFGPVTYAYRWEDLDGVIYQSPKARGMRIFLWNKLKFILLTTDGKQIKVRQPLGTQRYVREQGAFAVEVAKAITLNQLDAAQRRLAQGEMLLFGQVWDRRKVAPVEEARRQFADALGKDIAEVVDTDQLEREVPWIALTQEQAAFRLPTGKEVVVISRDDPLEVAVTLTRLDGLPRSFEISTPSLPKPIRYPINYIRHPYLVARLLAPEHVTHG